MKTSFSIYKQSNDMLKARMLEIRLQPNIAFRICYKNHMIPFSLELGLVFFTISYDVFNFKTNK